MVLDHYKWDLTGYNPLNEVLSNLLNIDRVHEALPGRPSSLKNIVILVVVGLVIGDLNLVFLTQMAQDVGGLSTISNCDC